MTLAWSYFGIWAIRFFFLWTLVYAENRNMYYNVQWDIENKFVSWELDGWQGRSMCVCQFFVLVGSHILKRKVQSEIWRRIQSNIRRQPGTAPFCEYLSQPAVLYFSKARCIVFVSTRCFVFLKSTVSYLSELPPWYKIQIWERRGPSLPNMIKHCWVIDVKSVLCGAPVKNVLPLSIAFRCIIFVCL